MYLPASTSVIALPQPCSKPWSSFKSTPTSYFLYHLPSCSFFLSQHSALTLFCFFLCFFALLPFLLFLISLSSLLHLSLCSLHLYINMCPMSLLLTETHNIRSSTSLPHSGHFFSPSILCSTQPSLGLPFCSIGFESS